MILQFGAMGGPNTTPYKWSYIGASVMVIEPLIGNRLKLGIETPTEWG